MDNTTPKPTTLSQKREQLRDLVRKGLASPPRSSSVQNFNTFEDHPAYRFLQEQTAKIKEMGLINPYNQTNEGIAGATTKIEGREYINFSSYNYLGLSGHPEVSRAACIAIENYGTSVSASRIVAGERPIHRQLEQTIAAFIGTEDALVFSGGYSTNASALGQMLGPGDLILYDVLSHSSIIAGSQLSSARRIAFAHNSPEDADRILTNCRREFERVLIAVEGVYSMDGDIAPLARLIELKERHGAILYVDEAHSLGVLGKKGSGLAEHAGIDPMKVDVWMGTLSKTAASCGGYIASRRSTIDFLRFSAPGFIYSAGIPASAAAAGMAAIKIMEREPERVERLKRNSEVFLNTARLLGLNTGSSMGTAVIPVIVGDSATALRLSCALAARSINVMPIMYPAVDNKSARLRFFISSEHSEDQLRNAATATAEELAHLRNGGFV